MSYDLMVFNPDVAPRTREEFMKWYFEQTEWTEEHSYDAPEVTSDNLKSLFIELIETYPPLNGPYSNEDYVDNSYVTDYSIGRNVIYAAFSWSFAEHAYIKLRDLAEKYKVGFFDVSADEGSICFPDKSGKLMPIDLEGTLSSIQQIKNHALPGQEEASVKDIIYGKLLPKILEQSSLNSKNAENNKSSWWKKLFRLK